ncbi:amino acid permease [Ancylostoma ceylanicum]|uniref:Solute carrier family 12 member 9 n=1 Tax=Ancylostoma ceylanicum TaxID=53326 RepID=A0A0D6M314_9BILA|nr:amino acid permease [Ancylostoma ceylanicum]
MYTIDSESASPYVMSASPENPREDDISRANNLPNGSSSPSIEFSQSRPNGLSTISGVFAPVALSMFSVLLFMRMGFVVGQLGFLMTVVQLAMAYAIVMLTVLSLCAISSNGAVEGGGVYYMISRSLGPEFGGAIGVLFFVANVFSCALYISGFTEALLNNLGNGQFPDSPTWRFFYCVLVSVALLILSLLGAGIFAKTALFTFILISICYSTWIFSVIFDGPMQIPIPKVNTPAYRVHENASNPESPMIVMLNQTLTANYTGFSFHTLGENMFTNYTMDYTTERQTDFALMFAIIFSGVTGLMAGANMSGELARPSVSIPRGTVQAVLTTLFVYIMTAFLMAATSSRYLLQNDYTVMMDTNFQRWFILIGIFSTTLFSSMSNLIGSSRVLNRLSHDKLFGCLLRPAKIEIGDRNPVVSVIITWLCVVGVFLIGAMNKIAKLTSIFFLLSYMGVNIACLALELTSAPNFRPTFKYFAWWTCALGVVCTTTMMLVVDASMSAIGVVVLMSLIMVLHYQAPAVSSGSISQALIYHQVRKYLLLLDVRKEHVKYWRPQILLLVSRPSSSCPLMDFVNDLKKSGLYVIGHVRKGDLDSNQAVDPLQQVFPYWLSLVDYLKLKAFVELTLSNSIRQGIQQLMRLSGLGAMKPNTVVLGFHEATPVDATLQESQLLKDLRYSKIDRAAVVEYFTAGDYMPKELNGNLERLTPVDYVNVLKDVLHMTKSLCVARHFHKMDKNQQLLGAVFKKGNILQEALSRGWNQKRYIDVWPVDLQRPVETGLGWDNSSLFLLQLACILSMSSRWRSHSRLRVFICVNSLQDMHRRDRQLKQMLDWLRIKAESVVVPWDHVVCHYPQSGAAANSQRPTVDLPVPYLTAFNDMIKRYSEEAAITLLNLPLPPDDANTNADRYLDQIRRLTDALPPTLMVHGVSSVISTAL